MAARWATGLLLVLLGLGACSRKGKERDLMLFYGECHVEVVAKTHGARINIDGIFLGENEAQTQISCGDKQIVVKKEGYIPYRGYFTVTARQPVRVVVELEKVKKKGDFALSSQLIDQVRRGRKPIDPWGPDAELLAKNDAVEEESVSAGPAKSGGATAPAAGAVSDGDPATVDYWR